MVLKCKMCGGDIHFIDETVSIVECEFCGTAQTIPKVDNEKKITLYNRANFLRIGSEYDRAALVYESILIDFPSEAEAYWGLCLCDYGIEYVDDPVSGKKVPTCHRTKVQSIMQDSNFLLACENADAVALEFYQEEAATIDQLQKDILYTVSNEDPFDVFISYKETDADGNRTEDSVLAQILYDALTEKGLKVFFSRITLRSKLGQQYEPIIYGALLSAKVMIVVGTSLEHYEAVWVRNEWSRYLDMMKTDRQKNIFFCFKDIDPYKDIPVEFRNCGLQAQTMGYVGWWQDTTSFVLNLLGKNQQHFPTGNHNENSNSIPLDISSYIKTGKIALKDKNWTKASSAFMKALEIDAECAEAHLGEYLARNHTSTLEELDASNAYFGDLGWQHMLEYADDTLKQRIQNLKSKWDDDWKRCAERVAKAREKTRIVRNMLAANAKGYIALKTDGSVVCVLKDNARVYLGWSKIVSVAAGETEQYGSIFAGIRSDGSIRMATVDFIGHIKLLQTDKLFSQPVKQLYIAQNHILALLQDGTLEACGSNEHGQCNVLGWHNPVSVAVGDEFSAAVSDDGTILLAGEIAKRDEIQNWKDITTLIAHRNELIGLDKYGRVLSNWPNTYAIDEFNILSEIIDVTGSSCIDRHYLQANGNVLYLGYEDKRASTDLRLSGMAAFTEPDGTISDFGIGIDFFGNLRALEKYVDGKHEKTIFDFDSSYDDKLFDDLEHIESEFSSHQKWLNADSWEKAFRNHKAVQSMVACNGSAIAAVKSDGTLFVLADEDMDFMWVQASSWTRLVAISISDELIAGLRDDGTVLLLDNLGHSISEEISDWQSIIQIAVQQDHIAGLSNDGHVYTYCHNSLNHHDTCTWDQIIRIYEDSNHTLGLRNDGTVLYADNQTSRTILHNILDVLDSRSIDSPICITADHEILHANCFDFDMTELVQYQSIGLNNSTYLCSDGSLFHRGQKLVFERHDRVFGNTERYNDFLAFTTDSLGKKCVAITKLGHLAVWGVDLTTEQKQKIYECHLFKGFDVENLAEERQAYFDAAEKMSNFYLAMQYRETIEIEQARLETLRTIKAEEDRLYSAECERDTIMSSPFRFLKKKEIERLTSIINICHERITNLKAERPEKKKWYGPFPIDERKNDYEIECQSCGRMNHLIFVRMSEYGYPIAYCDECLIKQNRYCVVCGEFDLNEQSNGSYTVSGAYVCPKCYQKAQGRQAIIGSILGKCSSCKVAHAPLWLSGKELYCEKCKSK